MPPLVAFLRAINVGGSKVMRMADLRDALHANGFPDAQTFIQTGNILFDSSEKNYSKLELQIHKIIQTKFGQDVEVYVLPRAHLEKMLKSNPFKGKKTSESEYLCVTFLHEKPDMKLLPKWNTRKDVEIVGSHETIVFSIAHRINGKSGAPQSFIETKLKTQGTTRKWEMLHKLLAK